MGSAIGGFLYARDLLHAAGYVVSAFVAAALVTVILTRPKRAQSNSRQRVFEADARRLQRRTLKVDHVAVVRAFSA